MLHATMTTDSKPRNGRTHPLPIDQLTVVQRAFQALASCDSLEEIKDIRNKADAVRHYAKSAKASLELQNKAAELKLRAERRAGELLQAMRLRGGDRISDSAGCRATLDRLGISRNQSTRWQKLAAISKEEFSEFLTKALGNGVELTTACLLRMATWREKKRADNRDLASTLSGGMPLKPPSTTSPQEETVHGTFIVVIYRGQ